MALQRDLLLAAQSGMRILAAEIKTWVQLACFHPTVNALCAELQALGWRRPELPWGLIGEQGEVSGMLADEG